MEHLFDMGARVIILGLSDTTVPLIRALNRDCGICPLLFAARRPFGLFPILRYSFVRCLMPQNNYYSLHSVLDMAALPHEVRTILIPCTSQFEKYVSDESDFFESEYIIRTPDQLNLIFPSLRRIARTHSPRRSQT